MLQDHSDLSAVKTKSELQPLDPAERTFTNTTTSEINERIPQVSIAPLNLVLTLLTTPLLILVVAYKLVSTIADVIHITATTEP